MSDKRLLKTLDANNKNFRTMPLVHMTDCYGLMGIVESRSLKIAHCEVMNEQLIYMFYGKPAYRTKHTGNLGLSANLPCCLIFNSINIVPKIKRIFPFDSGGFQAGLYKNYFHRKQVLENFELPGSLNYANKIVSYFFQSNEEYYIGHTRKNIEIDPLNFEIEGLVEIARAPSHPTAASALSPDERATAIEIQLFDDIKLEDNIAALIVPQISLESIELVTLINNLPDTKVIPYTVGNFADSNALAAVVYDRVFEYYKSQGVFDE